MEEPGGKLGGMSRRVKRSVISQRMHTQGFDGTFFVGSDFRVDMIIAGKSCTAEILRAILNPLDRPTCFERCDDGTDIARIDRHFVAETTANIGRYDADT